MKVAYGNDLIRRDVAVFQACNWQVRPDEELFNAIKEAIREQVNHAPAVDAVEVVRCRACRFYGTVPGFMQNDRYCPRTGIYPEPDFFCRDGKRGD